MTWIIAIIALVIGVGLGLLASFALGLWRTSSAREITAEIIQESEDRRRAELDAILGGLKSSFSEMSLEALSKANQELVTLGKSVLEAERKAASGDLGEKKSLIDQQLREMTYRLDNVSSLMNTLEKDREQKFGELAQHLKLAHEQYNSLSQSTSSLREALASTKARGQWGERMAEDVLRMAGFVENVNYVKQKATAEGKIPDFTFFLPKDLTLNMDAKFPLDNYMRYLEAGTDAERERHSKDFIRDVKSKVKEVKSREYINPPGGTVDYALLFIPNEQIYAFIHQTDSDVLDSAIRDKVIFCSPITLFAVLAVIRQAVDNFALEKTSNEIQALIGKFRKEWDNFIAKFDALGKKIAATQKEYDTLTTTRRRALDRPVRDIDALRAQHGIPASAGDPDDLLLEEGILKDEFKHDDPAEETAGQLVED